MQNETIHPKGKVEIIIEYRDGRAKRVLRNNTVLEKGRNALAASLGRAYGGEYQFYITNMLFGTNGVDGSNNPKYVDATRNSLYDGSPV